MSLDTWLSLTHVLGGVGIFIIGMIIMTDGLRSLAGDAIRKGLMRFTKTPTSGAITGAISTAILQSSSATTVASVGFVGAGLLAFPEALGIIFGANIGTTITGWLVALLGLKLKLGIVILPFILLGAILKLFFKDKVAAFGFALAGFGLIFVGIDWMQEGMSVFKGIITPDNLPSDTILGRLQLLFLGIIATIITQSSSAGVATTLTMLFAGVINFEQAAALVIGMDIGTTFTTAIATIGGSAEVKRTGFSHVIYNFFTGFAALLLIGPYILFWEWACPDFITTQAEIALVAFHTFFNTIGVIMVLPFTKYFAAMMEKLIQPSKQLYQQNLDLALLEDIPMALSMIQKSLDAEYKILLEHIRFMTGDRQHGKKANLDALEKVLDETQAYIDKIDLKKDDGSNWKRLVDTIHIIDHLQRLHGRCEENIGELFSLAEAFEKEKKIFKVCIEKQLVDAKDASSCVEKSAQKMRKRYEKERGMITQLMADGTMSITEGTKKLKSLRWLQRTSNHIARITFHLEEAILGAAK